MTETLIRHDFHKAVPIVDSRTTPISGFRLLELPMEIRQLVYDHAYGPDHDNVVPLIEVWIAILNYPPTETLDDFKRNHIDVRMHFDRGLINLQLAGKQVYKEANPTYYQNLLVKLDFHPAMVDGCWYALNLLHQAFRRSVKRIHVNMADTELPEFFPGLRGIMIRAFSIFGEIEGPEDLLSQLTDQHPDFKEYMDELRESGAKKHVQSLQCWFVIKHKAFTRETGPSSRGCISHTWIHHDPKTKKLETSKHPDAINRPATLANIDNLDISNFPSMEVSPYRHAPLDPKLRPYCQQD